MNPLALLPYWKWAAMAGLALALGVQTVRVADGKTELAQQLTANANTLANIAALTAKAERAVRAEEARRAAAIEGITRDAQASIDVARVDAAAAGRAAVSLRGQLATFVARARGAAEDPGAAAAGAPAGDPIGVLADVLSRADARAGIVEAYADAAHAAGVTCERSYEALSGTQR